MNEAEIVTVLNSDLTNEYKHMLFYLHATAMLQGPDRLHLGEFFRKQAESEMGHVLQFAHKIRASGGVPVNPPAFSFAPFTTGKLLLQYAIEMEQEVVANYHRRLKEFERLEEATGRHHDLVMFVEEQIEDSQSDVDEMLQIARGM